MGSALGPCSGESHRLWTGAGCIFYRYVPVAFALLCGSKSHTDGAVFPGGENRRAAIGFGKVTARNDTDDM